MFGFLGLPFTKWRDHLQYVVDSINRNKPNFKSQMNELLSYFTTPETLIIPQSLSNLYKFNINDKVRIRLTKSERSLLNFKYSLHYGMCMIFFIKIMMRQSYTTH